LAVKGNLSNYKFVNTIIKTDNLNIMIMTTHELLETYYKGFEQKGNKEWDAGYTHNLF
jgi:hypothetical protein